tara:strand:- start:237 stop:485 length:249 start_codon:yes stop_codon:yes gene_type:complete
MAPKWASTRESALCRCALDCAGGTLCIVAVLVALSYLLVSIPIAGTSDMPVWARSPVYLSVAHELGAVYDDRALPPSPPPLF